MPIRKELFASIYKFVYFHLIQRKIGPITEEIPLILYYFLIIRVILFLL